MRRPIGIFDSGLGGLTVVRAIRRRLPAESVVYFGDTARVPYGIKSRQTVTQFAVEDCEFLCRHDPKFIVVACNTASAAALPALRSRFSRPMYGVIEPGARAAAAGWNGRPIGIIGTEATVASGAYRKAIERLLPTAQLVEKACPLLVPLVEEGRSAGDPIVRAVLAEYLEPLREAGVGSVVLGCTHYPLLKQGIAEVFGPGVALIDSAEVVAEEVAAELARADLLAPDGAGGVRCFVSDHPQRFREVGARFLGEPIDSVTLVSAEVFFGDSEAPVVGSGCDDP
ncbi:MAG: glutamate racemase [Phycisphaerae bacterium]